MLKNTESIAGKHEKTAQSERRSGNAINYKVLYSGALN